MGITTPTAKNIPLTIPRSEPMEFTNELLNLDYLIYSSHKSGTQTLVNTLNGNGLTSRHCHSARNIGIRNGEFETFLDQYLKRNNKKLDVVTVFREPMARHVSSFFQGYGTKPLRLKQVASTAETIIHTHTIAQLQERFISELRDRSLIGFAESIHEICKELRIDTRDLTFDRESGFGIFERENVRIYLLRFDILFDNPAKLLAKITGKAITVKPDNMSESKWYRTIYSNFKATLVIPDDLAREVRATKQDLIDIFYSGEGEPPFVPDRDLAPKSTTDTEAARSQVGMALSGSNSGQRKPNILLLMSDQHRADAMGCSGGWIKTPNLDRIAAEGIRFGNCITTSPTCIPARIGLATGLYPHQTGIWRNAAYTLPRDRPTWIKGLRAAGYRMSLFGKTHWHPQENILPDSLDFLPAIGFDDFIEVAGPHANASSHNQMTHEWQSLGLWKIYQEDMVQRNQHRQTVRPSPLALEHYYDVWVARQACQYLASYNLSQPWFCWVSFPGPHEPWDAPEPYASMYDPADMPAPLPIPDSDPNRPQGQLDRRFEQWRGRLQAGDPAKLRANYAGNVTLIDDQIGKILDVIDKRGELDNTIIVYISDHGEMNGDCGLLFKGNFMQGAVRVPLLIRTPGTLKSAVAGWTYPHPVELLDLGPTLADLAGASLDIEQSGKSLEPVLRDPQQLHRVDALSEFDQEVMLQSDRWKVALNQHGQVYLLFDLENDPEETINLANRPDFAQIEKELRARCLARSGRPEVT